MKTDALVRGGGKHLQRRGDTGLKAEAQVCGEAGLTKTHASESRGWV